MEGEAFLHYLIQSKKISARQGNAFWEEWKNYQQKQNANPQETVLEKSPLEIQTFNLGLGLKKISSSTESERTPYQLSFENILLEEIQEIAKTKTVSSET
jgi:hypothetical protein